MAQGAPGAASVADLVLVVVDGSAPLDPADRQILDRDGWRSTAGRVEQGRSRCRTARRAIPARFRPNRRRTRCASARRLIKRALDVEARDDPPAITNLRHIALARAGARFVVPRPCGGRRRRRPALGRVRAGGSPGRLARRSRRISGRIATPMTCSRTSSRASVSANDISGSTSSSSAPDMPGCEAAYAAARLGARVGLCTLSTGHRRAHAVQSGRSAARRRATSFGRSTRSAG